MNNIFQLVLNINHVIKNLDMGITGNAFLPIVVMFNVITADVMMIYLKQVIINIPLKIHLIERKKMKTILSKNKF